MSDKPNITDIEWALTDVIDPVTSVNNKIVPSSTKKTQGWDRLEKPPREYVNWIWYEYYKWMKYFNNPTPYIMQQEGIDLAITASTSYDLAAMTKERIVLWNGTGTIIQAYDFNGYVFASVGNSLNIGATAGISIIALSPTRIIIFDGTNNQIEAYDFDGTNWTLTGTPLSLSGTTSGSLARLTATRLAFVDGTNNELAAYDFTGTTFTLVGNKLPMGTITTEEITGLSSNSIAYHDQANDELRKYTFDDTDWTLTGTPLSVTTSSALSMCSYSENFISMFSFSFGSGEIRTYEYISSTWIEVSHSFVPQGLTTGAVGIEFMSATRLAWIDSGTDDLRCYGVISSSVKTPREI